MNIKNLIITIVVAMLVGVGVYYYKPKEAEIKLPFPYTTSVDPSVGLSCEAVVGSLMYGSNIREDEKGIHASLFKGTDKIAIELDDEGKFSFLTKASLEAGDAKSSENWTVLQNNDKFLIATLTAFEESVPIRNFADMFYLNKENGMALWVKTSATSLFSNTPESQSYLLKCM